jgi:hypothetical protein
MVRKNRRSLALLSSAVCALFAANAHGGTSTNTAGPVQQGQSNGGTGNPSLNNPAETISMGGLA